MEAFVYSFKSQMMSLSNAPYNGGVFRANGFFFMQVHKNYNGDYKRDCFEFAQANGLKNFVGFMTAANIRKVLSTAEFGNVKAYVTAGITNPAIAGNNPPQFLGKTINIALVIEEGLTLGAMVNAIMTATEAKTYALLNLGYNATGTTSDGIGVFAFRGEQEWAGTATELGMHIARAVRKAIKESLKKWEMTKSPL
ncbi:adenosylcobinamide amidohydrolase [Thermococcus sp. MV5]|uniref:adenosylcobinamide amidohydrolase n=1 Tax=Thermococcus sp. MV5 TaxID=1638272 RepID=UPI00143C2D2A|nr:adenosylcobinamide amidohydrolase [Thermococcus sp. MV5]NJE26718.1 adenosylcobinamide amidohydrolase [Thermococcus sp. MV5]